MEKVARFDTADISEVMIVVALDDHAAAGEGIAVEKYIFHYEPI